jgi:hypothetical protein
MNNDGLKSAVIGLLLIVGTLACAADEAYRTFKSTDGKEITARIVEYDANACKVKLKSKGSGAGWIPISSLSSEDQAYVSEWYSKWACFLSDDLFRIKLTGEDSGWGKGIGPLVEERHSRFVMKLSNCGNADLDNIRIVCCEIWDKDGATTYSHSNLKTTKVCAGDAVDEEKTMFSDRNKTRKTIDSLIGVRMRLYWTSPDGREFMREISSPMDLSDEKYPWKDMKDDRVKPVVNLTPEEWRARFLSDDLFEVKLIEEDDGWQEDLGVQEQRYTGYVIKLSNHGDADLDNIRIVCCEIREKNGATTYAHSNLETTGVFAKERVEEGKVLRSFRNRTRKILDSVIGVRMRLYWTSPDGREFMREISSPEDLSNEKYPWKDPEKEKQEGPVNGKTELLPIIASISDVSTEEREHTAGKRTYKAQTFEYAYSIGPCKSLRTISFFEFKNRRGKITFMSSEWYQSKGPSQQTRGWSVLYVDAEEHGLKDVELNAYWIQIYAVDESGESHLVAEAHDGCSSLEELKKRNDPPVGV